MMIHRKHQSGFTLVELLVSLSILAEIATFTIPKIIVSQQNQRFKAIAKESASMVAAAYQQYKTQNAPDSSTGPVQLTPYLNYVSVDTASLIDDLPFNNSVNCGGWHIMCLRLHSGAMLWLSTDMNFAGTGSTNGVYFELDPDGSYSGTTNGTGKAVEFFLYYNGRVTSRDAISPNTVNSINTYQPSASATPTWFGWN